MISTQANQIELEATGDGLSINQERVLLSREMLRRQRIKRPENILSFGIQLHGFVDHTLIETVLNEIARRHAGLRTRIVRNTTISKANWESRVNRFGRTGLFEPGLYVRVVVESAPVQLQRANLAMYPAIASSYLIKRLLKKGHSRPFGDPPLLRALLVKLQEKEHLLILFVDHIVSDWHSLQIIYEDFRELYHFGLIGGSSAIPGRSGPECEAWPCPAFHTTHVERDLIYWKRQWTEFGCHRIGFHHLPFSLPQPQSETPKFRSVHADIGSASAETLRQCAARYNVSPYMLFLAAYAVVLHHYTGKVRIALWAHCANRANSDNARTVGFLVNTHLVGLDLTGDPNVRDLLRRVQKSVLGMITHQELPLQHIWNRLRCAPRLADAGLLLDWHAVDESSELPSGGLEVRRVNLPEIVLPRASALAIDVREHARGIDLIAKFLSSRFHGPAVQEMLEDLRAVVTLAAADADRRISALGANANRYAIRRNPSPDVMNEFVACGFPDVVHDWN